MEYKHCTECGEKLKAKEIGDEGLIPFCYSCEKPYFDFILPCVIAAVVNEHGEVALLKQDFRKTIAWALVSAYMKKGETLEGTLSREVKEETGQHVEDIKYIGSYYSSENDLVMIGFVALVKKKDFVKSKEILEIDWFNPDDALDLLVEGSIAKRHFENIIELGLI
jgi:NAD+ diphosphatase